MRDQNGPLFLGDADLARLGITPSEVVSAIEDAIRDAQEGRLWAAPKSAILPGDGRYTMATLAASDPSGVVVVKTVMVSPENPARGLPTINGAILILDAETGLLLAVMDANWVTAARTAGLSAVAAKRLADPDAGTMAFIGCGVQAHSHLEAFRDLFQLREIRAFGRGGANIEKLCATARAKGLRAIVCTDPQAALDGADLVVSSVTLDHSMEPFLDARWLKPGAFAAITDQGSPWRDEGMKAFKRVYVDDLEQEKAMEKKMVAPELITGDLAALVLDTPAVAHDPASPGAFIFRGMALGDLALAGLAYRRAVAL